jgi:hypothetical protein
LRQDRPQHRRRVQVEGSILVCCQASGTGTAVRIEAPELSVLTVPSSPGTSTPRAKPRGLAILALMVTIRMPAAAGEHRRELAADRIKRLGQHQVALGSPNSQRSEASATSVRASSLRGSARPVH